MGDQGINIHDVVNEEIILECRTCLHIMSPDAVLFNVFEKWTMSWDGMANSIAEDLEKVTNVKVQLPDKHSKVICRTCYELLYNACTFLNLVKQSDRILQDRYSLEQETDKVWPKPIQLDKSINSLINESSMNIEIKQEVLSDDEDDGMNGVHENGDVFVKLDIKVEPEEMTQQQPSEQFTINGLRVNTFEAEMTQLTNGTSEEHLANKVKEELLSEEEVEPVQSDLSLECLLCAKDFNSVSGLKAHVIAQHSYRTVKRKNNSCISPEKKKCNYICAICRRNFTTSTDLMVHETCHNRSVCYGCNQSFDTFEQLTVHRQTCKAITSQEVKKPKTLDDVLRPQPQEQTSRSKCTHCDETFTDMYYVTIHQEIHHSALSEKTNCQEKSSMKLETLDKTLNDISNS